MREIDEGESTMHRKEDGTLLRVLEYVEVEMHFRKRILVETHQEFDGRTRARFTLMGEKMKAGETSKVHI